MNTKKLITISALIVLSGCAATGENLKGNVYKAGQVNSSQNARTIKITAVLPAQIEVDNSKQQKQAMVAGGALGVAAGSMVADKVLVEGVSIAYLENGKMYTSAQVGKLCEFKPNATALIISTGTNETRIQPNATCPVEK